MSKEKIIDLKRLSQEVLPSLHCEGDRVIFTNGCFDILHRGHIAYLAEAKALGDVLIVGLNSDASVSKLKGDHRPLQDERSRAEILAALMYVDHVVIFEEDTPLRLITMIQPDVLVKGGDYKAEEIVGYKEVLETGGRVEIISFLEGYSTSNIENKIKRHG